jgi:Zn-dependent protease with chaperone function
VADIAPLYPPSPANVPADLTTPSKDYRGRVLVVLASLFAFLLVYLGLTVGMAFTTYWCFATLTEPEPAPSYQQPTRSTRGSPQPARRSSRGEKPVLGLVIGGVASAMIFLFMVKGFFKRGRLGSGGRVELTEAAQPELFAFIRKLCDETKAPFPHRVYATVEVNAAVAYNESILNLFLPAKKNLIIGLGLVNRLNLAEFKAVLAHEFGHFSQKSMKLGTYVYTSNRVIGDVVYGRDALDDFIGVLRNTDIRIAVFAWAFTGVLWLTRKMLEGLFRVINFANSSLSRQMEYNADLVAVSVTGSDSLIFALARLDFASETLSQAWVDLAAAADHGRYSRDLYFHQTRAAEFLKLRRNNPMLGEVPELPADPSQTVQVFKPEDTSVPAMWATHPANHDREVNAKARYIRSPLDDRPAWALFREADDIRERIARIVYEANRKEKIGTLEDPAAVQAFIDAEHAETTYHPRYHGLYEDRYLKPGELAELTARSTWEELLEPEKLAAAHDRLYGELKDRMGLHKSRLEETGKLGQIVYGGMALRGSDFEHRGRRHGLSEAKKLLEGVQEELDEDYKWMHALDRDVFRVHYAMAVQLAEADRAMLEDRYRFHLELQNVHLNLRAHNNHVNQILAGIAGQRQVNQAQFQEALGALRQAHVSLDEQLGAADEIKMPALTNIEAGSSLGALLLSGKLVKNLRSDSTSLPGDWINQFMTQLDEVMGRTARMLFKSLGGLLAHEESIAARWAAAQENQPLHHGATENTEA